MSKAQLYVIGSTIFSVIAFTLFIGCGSVFEYDKTPDVSCSAEMLFCDEACVPISSQYCGDCSTHCGYNEECNFVGDSYRCQCKSGFRNCGTGGCNVNIQKHVEHCGACFQPCKRGETCHGECLCGDGPGCSGKSICVGGECIEANCVGDRDCKEGQVCHFLDNGRMNCIDYQRILPFKMTWRVLSPGTITIALSSENASYIKQLFDVDCNGDGSYFRPAEASKIECKYEKAGTYTIAIRGHFSGLEIDCTDLQCANEDDMVDPLDPVNDEKQCQLLSIDQWGENPWYTFKNFTYYCDDLHLLATDVPDLQQTISFEGMFRGAQVMNEPMANWQVDHVINMSAMFDGASAFNQDISNWDVSNVSNMSLMFRGALAFNQDLSTWHVDNVTNMEEMFRRALAFNQDLSTWHVDNVTNMQAMFMDTKVFNQNLNDWHVNNVTKMISMFRGAEKFNGNISSWQVGNVTDMGGMFSDCSSFDSDIGNWDVSNVTDMGSMFYGAKAFNRDISKWDVSKVTRMGWMFCNASAFKQNISKWQVGNVVACKDTFNGCGIEESQKPTFTQSCQDKKYQKSSIGMESKFFVFRVALNEPYWFCFTVDICGCDIFFIQGWSEGLLSLTVSLLCLVCGELEACAH